MEVKQVRWSEENIIGLIRKLRNDLINDFLDDQHLKEYILRNFNNQVMPPIKVELLKQDLKRLLSTPVDVAHYSSLIKLIQETDTASLSEGNEQLFYSEVENVIKDYV